MTAVSPRESRWTVWRFVTRRQRVALALSGVLVSGLVALVSRLMSVTDNGLHDFAHVAVSPLERFLFGLLMTAGISIGWPVARRISMLRMMAAVAVGEIDCPLTKGTRGLWFEGPRGQGQAFLGPRTGVFVRLFSGRRARRLSSGPMARLGH
jgi:hypothetical protein